MKKFALIIFIVLISVLLVLSHPWNMIYLGLQMTPDPPKPQITYGEFPLILEYEINGTRKTVSDILICEYDGIDMNEGLGKFRKWKDHLASGNENIVLLEMEGDRKIIYAYGSGDYYMGDSEYEQSYDAKSAYLVYSEDKEIQYKILGPEVLAEKYKIQIINWKIAEPITNKFIE